MQKVYTYLQSINLPKWPRYPNLVAEITIERLIGNWDLLYIHFIDSRQSGESAGNFFSGGKIKLKGKFAIQCLSCHWTLIFWKVINLLEIYQGYTPNLYMNNCILLSFLKIVFYVVVRLMNLPFFIILILNLQHVYQSRLFHII